VDTGGAAARTPCAGAGTDCSGFCEGIKTDACVYPGDSKESGTPECTCEGGDCESGPAVEKHLVCDGSGGVKEANVNCGATSDDPTGGIKCAPPEEGASVSSACLAECSGDADCFDNYFCDSTGKQCLLLPDGGRCDETGKLLRTRDADPVSCGDYICQPNAGDSGGACLNGCTKKADCADPALSCNTDGQCVSGPAEPSETPSCSVSAAGGRRDPSALALAFAALAWAGARRRRRAPTRSER
jgi:MYXO-CTERM domain-containing protein